MSVAPPPSYGWTTEAAARSVPYVTPVVASILRAVHASRVLDLGCGNGAMSARLATEGFDLVGCDRDADGIEIARAAYPGVEFHCVGFDRVPGVVGGEFEAVLASEVIEHLYDPAELLRCARRMLTPGGTLVVTTPHYGWFKQASVVLSGRWDQHHQTSRVGGHIKLFTPTSMRRILREEGFRLDRLTGAGRFAPFWKSMVAVATKS